MKKASNAGFNPVAVAVAGAIVGAGIAVASTIVLSDKKKREKIGEVFESAKDTPVVKELLKKI